MRAGVARTLTIAGLLAAIVTGAFSAVFALFVSFVAPRLTMTEVVLAGGVSGFLGSLFARSILGGRP